MLLYAAGSLRDAMTALGRAFSAADGPTVRGIFGPSGTLRDRLAKGERANVFASANMEHPRSLQQGGRAGPVRCFARNVLCALSSPPAAVSSDTLLERMLDPSIRLGTSTPGTDPSGDYAFALFARAEALQPGARARLEGKALQLTGGPASPPPAGRSVYGMLVARGEADIFLTYRTNAIVAQREVPGLVVTPIPAALAVAADYGIAVVEPPTAEAEAFVGFVLSTAGWRILAAHGFTPP